ncbi:LURP-one-related/scramblase family protein [Acidipropionibacterium jensenii]|uniref:LURP-one-related/scramblase family protein n=1 Tax=Acidipropionibacterium jensenii TaxID=1749 RepID=UPI00214C085E|nr:hypothetical protein [Acidipropionibacterium jensenii]
MALVDQNVLILQQIRSFLRNDFAILDASGAQIASIHTEGSGASRALAGARDLTVLENGYPVLRISDPPNLFSRDTYTVSDGNGLSMATITKEFSVLSRKLRVELSDGSVLQCAGSLFGLEFTISQGQAVAARVARRMPGLSAALMGHDRYLLQLAPDLPPLHRGAMIGTVVTIDLIRAKESRIPDTT